MNKNKTSSTIIKDPVQIVSTKYFNLLCMLYVTMLLAAVVMAMYVAKLGSFTFTVGAAVIPFMYFFGDVIAEVYGYSRSRNLIWYALICEIFFVGIVLFMVNLPSPSYFKLQHEYQDVLSLMYRVLLSNLIILPMSEFLNIFALTKFKILLKGRFFWLRSISSSAVGELILAILGNLITFFGILSPLHLFEVICASFLMKICFSMIAVIPASLLVRWLKKRERIDVYDYSTNFNPFKLNPHS